MGRKSQKIFDENPELLFGNLDNIDVIIYSSQECKRAIKTQVMESIEAYVNEKGFVLIGFEQMWEMFVIAFIRRDLRFEVKQIQTNSIAKGKLGMIGNKGAV